MTHLTTLPFLMLESGAASFTLAVTMSPRPACKPLSPPRGRMHCNRRAPLLSATSRIVLIPIMVLPSRLQRLSLFGQSDGRQRRAADDFAQRPALQLAQWTALYDPHYVAQARVADFVVSVELLA